MAKAQGAVQNLGPAGERVAENIRQLRGSTTYRELSERLEALGRPIPVLGLSRIESQARRVDADDLLALAIALGVNPNRLLMPDRDRGDVELTPTVTVSFADAWAWALGMEPVWAGPYAPEEVTMPRAARDDFQRHAWPAALRLRTTHPAMVAAEDVRERIDDLLTAVENSAEGSEPAEAVDLAMARLQAEVAEITQKARRSSGER